MRNKLATKKTHVLKTLAYSSWRIKFQCFRTQIRLNIKRISEREEERKSSILARPSRATRRVGCLIVSQSTSTNRAIGKVSASILSCLHIQQPKIRNKPE